MRGPSRARAVVGVGVRAAGVRARAAGASARRCVRLAARMCIVPTRRRRACRGCLRASRAASQLCTGEEDRLDAHLHRAAAGSFCGRSTKSVSLFVFSAGHAAFVDCTGRIYHLTYSTDQSRTEGARDSLARGR